MAYCENCGQQISDLAVACPNCGHPTRAEGQPPATGTGDALGRPLAEWWKRAVAYIADSLIIAVPAVLLMAGFSFGVVSGDSVGGVFSGAVVASWLLIFVLGLGYYVYFHGGEKGQTVGKMMMHIAVRDADGGGSIGYGRALGRWGFSALIGIACGLLTLLDLLWPLWDARRQTWHDKVVRSLVVEVD